MNELNPGIVTAGVAVIDEYLELTDQLVEDAKHFLRKPPCRQVGGMALRIAQATAHLGVSTTLVSGVGDDPTGEELARFLDEHSIARDYVDVWPDVKTGQSTIIVTPNNTRTVIMHLPTQMLEQHIDMTQMEDLRRKGEVFVLDGSGNIGVQLQLAESLHTAHAKTVIANIETRGQAEDLIPFCNVVVGSAQFLREWRPNAAPEDVALELARQGPSLAGFTLGSEGSVFVSTREGSVIWTFPFPIPADRVVDTTAAGDMFLGGMAYAVYRQRSHSETLRFATAAASFAVEQIGLLQLPSEQELLARAASVRQHIGVLV